MGWPEPTLKTNRLQPADSILTARLRVAALQLLNARLQTRERLSSGNCGRLEDLKCLAETIREVSSLRETTCAQQIQKMCFRLSSVFVPESYKPKRLAESIYRYSSVINQSRLRRDDTPPTATAKGVVPTIVR